MQGSHIVVPKLYQHERCYFFQNPDGRIFFAIPYEEAFTLIGTTDQDYSDDPSEVGASVAEIGYLIAAANRYFKRRLARADVIWSYSGVRPLYDDGAGAAKDATRDYVLTLESGPPALLTIYGGKITTYRRLAEEALQRLAAVLPQARRNAGWTARAALPGGDFAMEGAEALAADVEREYPFLTTREARRYVRHYGTETRRLLQSARRRADLGQAFGGDLTEAEVAYVMAREYAKTAEDVVWRRTKSGLRMRSDEIAALDEWMTAQTRVSSTA